MYCGKSVEGEKIYRAKHYLFYNIKELVELYNDEHGDDDKTTYYQMREVITQEKHFLFQGKTPEDDCRCETCENGELFLEAIRSIFTKQKEKNLIKNLPMDPLELVQLGVCSVKSSVCMNGHCGVCPGTTPITEICENLEKVESLTYYKWTTKNKVVCKISDEISGEEAVNKLVELISGEKLRLHRYNMYRQYAELKWLKRNLKIDEVILSTFYCRLFLNIFSAKLMTINFPSWFVVRDTTLSISKNHPECLF